MHLLFTDSGVGGLSVCAYAERSLRMHDLGEPVRLTYVNASPENDFGYNSMATRREKVENFDRFLRIVADGYAPDSIFVACNTLSVLLHDVPFMAETTIPVRGIVEIGAERLRREIEERPDAAAIVFGTPTTIDEGAYPKRLTAAGVAPEMIVSQACFSLADTISEDRHGTLARAKIDRYVRAAVEQLPTPVGECIAYLACTHYGYRREFFEAAFRDVGIAARILNPNEFVVDDLFASEPVATGEGQRTRKIDVEFVSRYRIPETALETIGNFLENVSPATIEAFRGYSHRPGLF